MDDPVYLSVYSPVRDSKRSLAAASLYQTGFQEVESPDSRCSCVVASRCPPELVVRQGPVDMSPDLVS